MNSPSTAVVIAVSASTRHDVRKQPVAEIELVAGHGVLGDAHAGATVQHLHAQRKDPAKPNLRQVHLIGRELLDDLARLAQSVSPGELGENVLTAGVELLSLPEGTRLRLGQDAVVRLTGKRDPCRRINEIRPGLMKLCFGIDSEGRRTGRIGVLGVVEEGGTIRPGDAVAVELPDEPHLALEYV